MAGFSLSGMGAFGAAEAMMGKQVFLQLLSTQMQNQNPLDPMDNTEFISQLAQFSSLEQASNLNKSFGALLQLVEFGAAKDLIGQRIVYQDPYSGAPDQTGEVEGLRMEGGQACVVVGGQSIPLAYVTGIDSSPEAASEAPDDEPTA